ncbi:unnamed protein product, partial [Choristocarpus tenellus]
FNTLCSGPNIPGTLCEATRQEVGRGLPRFFSESPSYLLESMTVTSVF